MTESRSFEHFLRVVLRVERAVTLTAAQWVLIRVCFDGADPVDLGETDQAIAYELFGAVERIPSEARHVLALLKGARVGGTWLASLHVLYLGLTCALDGLAPGEVGFGVIVAPDMRLAAQAFRYVAGAVDSTPSIAALVTARTSDSITLKRPDGHVITVECLPATRGGTATRGRTLFSALLDELSFFRDADSGQVNDLEVYRSIVVRVLLGGRVLAVSTAWLESGLLHELIQANHGHPSTALACIAPTLTMRTDDRIRAIVEEERSRDSANAAREFDCQPLGGGASAFFDPNAIKAAVDEDRTVSLPPSFGKASAGADLAFVNDSSAIVIVQAEGGRFHVADTLELRPQKGAPLRPSSVVEQFAAVCQRYGLNSVVADGHYKESLREHLEAQKMTLSSAPEGQPGKVAMFTQCRALLHEGRLRLPNNPRLLTQLRDIVAKPTPGGGLSITSPRRKNSGHGDLVSALVCAVWCARRHANTSTWQPPVTLEVNPFLGPQASMFDGESAHSLKGNSAELADWLRRSGQL